MKKTFLKREHLKSFLLGFIILFVTIGFFNVIESDNEFIKKVQAAASVNGGGASFSGSSEPADFTYPFLGPSNSLVNRIGSLTFGSNTTAPWITSDTIHGKTCLTGFNRGGEKESCLAVNGIGSFSKLFVYGIPAYITNNLLLSPNAGNSYIGAQGLMIANFPGSDDSIMASGLQYEANGAFAPRDTTTLRHVCATPDKGILYPCDAGTPTYTCTGTTPSNATLCSGDDTNLTADTAKTVVSSCGTPKCEYTCNAGYHLENGSCIQDETYTWHSELGSCDGAVPASCTGQWTVSGENDRCEGDGELMGVHCNDQTNETDCNDFNDSVDTGSCTWVTENVTHDCSTNPTWSESDCRAQNSACTWTDGVGNHRTVTVTCVDSSGTIVSDSNCDASTKPSESSQFCLKNPGCYPKIYSEYSNNYTADYVNERDMCDDFTTESDCMEASFMVAIKDGHCGGNPSMDLNIIPMTRADWEQDNAIDSYGYISHLSVNPDILDVTGNSYPQEETCTASNTDTAQTYLGAGCIWGDLNL